MRKENIIRAASLAALMLVFVSAGSRAWATDWCLDYVGTRNYEQAIKACTDLIAEKKDKPAVLAEAHYARGFAYYDYDEMVLAAEDFTSALKYSPNLQMAYFYRGNARINLGRYEDAIADLTRAIELQPGNADSYYNRGRARFASGNRDAALADFSKALDVSPMYSMAYVGRGVVYGSMGENSKALVDFNKAADLSPTNAEIYYNRGNIYFNMGDYAGASDDYGRAIANNPSHLDAHLNRAAARTALREFDPALADYTRASELAPKDIRPRMGLGGLYKAKGDYARSIAQYKVALALAPNNPLPSYSLAGAHALKGETAEGCKWLQRSLRDGFKNRELIKKDRDLDPLRTSRCYDEALKGRLDAGASVAQASALPASSQGQGAFTIQFGLFGSKPNAERLIARLRKQGLDVLVSESADKNGKAIYLAHTRAVFATQAEATDALASFKKGKAKGIEAYVVRKSR